MARVRRLRSLCVFGVFGLLSLFGKGALSSPVNEVRGARRRAKRPRARGSAWGRLRWGAGDVGVTGWERVLGGRGFVSDPAGPLNNLSVLHSGSRLAYREMVRWSGYSPTACRRRLRRTARCRRIGSRRGSSRTTAASSPAGTSGPRGAAVVVPAAVQVSATGLGCIGLSDGYGPAVDHQNGVAHPRRRRPRGRLLRHRPGLRSVPTSAASPQSNLSNRRERGMGGSGAFSRHSRRMAPHKLREQEAHQTPYIPPPDRPEVLDGGGTSRTGPSLLRVGQSSSISLPSTARLLFSLPTMCSERQRQSSSGSFSRGASGTSLLTHGSRSSTDHLSGRRTRCFSGRSPAGLHPAAAPCTAPWRRTPNCCSGSPRPRAVVRRKQAGWPCRQPRCPGVSTQSLCGRLECSVSQ